MSSFKKYAHYYDLLYRDKDYPGEAQFIHKIIQKHSPRVRSILELGCGTGSHAVQLASLNYTIHCIDLSPDMLDRARSRRSEIPSDHADRISFTQGDIRNIRLENSFDAVIALFHVISYQARNADLRAAFATASAHLKRGGIFIFDYWYGPAVFTNLPNVRVKRAEDETMGVLRLTEPLIKANENVVDINYLFIIQDKLNNTIELFNETHQLRMLFKPELDLFLNDAGFNHIDFKEWFSDCDPGLDTWSVYSVAKVT